MLLTKDDVQEYVDKYRQGSEAARELLFHIYNYLVIAEASKWYGYFDYSDLIAEANLELVKAINRIPYRPADDNTGAYIRKTIRYAVRRMVNKNCLIPTDLRYTDTVVVVYKTLSFVFKDDEEGNYVDDALAVEVRVDDNLVMEDQLKPFNKIEKEVIGYLLDGWKGAHIAKIMRKSEGWMSLRLKEIRGKLS